VKAITVVIAVCLSILWSVESVQARDREREVRDWFQCIKTKPVINCYAVITPGRF